MDHLLTYLIFLPLCASIVILLLPGHRVHLSRWVCLVTSLLQAVVLTIILAGYDTSKNLQFVSRADWITIELGSWGIFKAEYMVGLDGLNTPLVILTVAIMLLSCLQSWNTSFKTRGYFSLLLLLNTAILGTFTSFDLLLFYLFFEFMLLPMFFLIGIWGGPRREYASVKFFLYTLLGSIFILVAFIGLYLSYSQGGENVIHTFNLLTIIDPANALSDSLLDPRNPTIIGSLDGRSWAFLFLFIGFGIKLPMVPLHTWLPDAHVEASTPISVILAALLLKIGGYGLLRVACPIFPDAAADLGWLVGSVGVMSIIYGAFNAMGSKDLKRLIAYSSVSHMGFVLLGIASGTAEGISGTIFQMFSHGITSAMLFVIAGILYDRTSDRTIAHYSGLASAMPVFFVFVLIAFFASLGLPGFSGFIGEIMVLLGAFSSARTNGLLHAALAIIATTGLILSAGYFLWTIQRMFFGSFNYQGRPDKSQLTDLTGIEKLVLVPLAAATIIFGIFPQLLFNLINPFTGAFLEIITGDLNK